MPNAQLAPPTDMDLDETTFVTSITSNDYPDRTSDVTSIRVPGRAAAIAHGLDVEDEQSDSLVVPSPSFSGFHSARSSPGAPRILNNVGDESNILDGHTLIEEQQSTFVDVSNQDLSFLSAHEHSASDAQTQSQEQHDRQVVDELQVPAGANGSGNDSLLSIVRTEVDGNSAPSKPSSIRSMVEEDPDVRRDYAGQDTDDWEEIHRVLATSTSSHEDDIDRAKDKLESHTDDEDKDSLIHSNQSLNPSPRPSPPTSQSRKPPPSAQRDSPSEITPKTKKSKTSSRRKTDFPAEATATHSQRPGRVTDSEIPFFEDLEVIDLTQTSPSNTPHKAELAEHETPQSTPKSKIQRMTEVSIPPKSQKKSKRRSSRKM